MNSTRGRGRCIAGGLAAWLFCGASALAAQSNFESPPPPPKVESTTVATGTGVAHTKGFPRALKVDYDKFTDSTLVTPRPQDATGMGLGSILSMKSVWINAGFLYPGRVYTQTPTAILFTATLDATRTTPVAVQPLAAGDMIFLLDDSTRLRYPTKHIGGSLDVATRDAAFSNTHDILGALIPVTDFIRIAAARKVEMSIPDYHFTMSGDARHALAALVGVLTPDSAVAK